MPHSRTHYRPGDVLRASDVNYLLRNANIDAPNCTNGVYGNSILPESKNEQIIADLTDSNISVSSFSLIYCDIKSNEDEDYEGGLQWSKAPISNGHPFYTAGSTSNETTDSEGNNKSYIAVEPVIPGRKYILRADSELIAGSFCKWNGDKLICSAEGDFIVTSIMVNGDNTFAETIYKVNGGGGHYIRTITSSITGPSQTTKVTINGKEVDVACPLLSSSAKIASGAKVVISRNAETGIYQIIEAACE